MKKEQKEKVHTISKYRFSIIREPNASYNRVKVTSRHDVTSFCKTILEDQPLENICVIGLDNGHRITGYQIVEGTFDQCALYPANVFRFILSVGAAALIIAHNHPGNCEQPSEADWDVTAKLQFAAKSLDIQFLDHLVVCDNQTISMKESSRW